MCIPQAPGRWSRPGRRKRGKSSEQRTAGAQVRRNIQHFWDELGSPARSAMGAAQEGGSPEAQVYSLGHSLSR